MSEEFDYGFSDSSSQDEKVVTPTVEPSAPVVENLLGGIVGAFLFSLIGGVVWFLLYQIGFLAAISGIVGVVCAIKGYAVFGKCESKRGIVISTIIAFLVIVLAWYLCFAYDVYLAYQAWYEEGEVDYTISMFEAIGAGYVYFADPAIAIAYLKDLVIGMIFCVVGAFGYVKAAIKKTKKLAEAESQVTLEESGDQEQ